MPFPEHVLRKIYKIEVTLDFNYFDNGGENLKNKDIVVIGLIVVLVGFIFRSVQILGLAIICFGLFKEINEPESASHKILKIDHKVMLVLGLIIVVIFSIVYLVFSYVHAMESLGYWEHDSDIIPSFSWWATRFSPPIVELGLAFMLLGVYTKIQNNK